VNKVIHLDDKQIVEAVIDESGLHGELRRHLFECPDCRAQKEVLAGDLARFGQISREQAHLNYRKPRIVGQRAGWFAPVWRVRPALGLGLVFATFLALLLYPPAMKRDRLYTQEVVYNEMVQDAKFMTEIEKLEENPLPRFYVNMEDQGEQEGDAQLPGARMDKGPTHDGESRDG